MLKKTILVLGVTLIAFVGLDKFRVSTAQTTASEGKIGDVKYSVLDPTRFREKNGPGWTLMDGKGVLNNKPFEESELSTFSGLRTIPDAQGVFIRGVNGNRDAATGDPEGRERLVTSYQSDMIIDHTHQYLTGRQRSWADFGEGQYARPIPEFIPAQTDSPTNTNPHPQPRVSGVETRPRNIALYTYLKINE